MTDDQQNGNLLDGTQAGTHGDDATRGNTPRPIESPAFDELIAPVELPRRRPPLRMVVATVIAVVAVVALIAAIAVIRPFGTVRASDYSEGAKRTVALQKRYEATSAAIDDALGFLYSQDTAYDAAKVSALKVQATKLRDSADDFGNLKVTRNDDVAAAYASYQRQAIRFAELSTNLAESAQALSAMNDACGSTPSGTVYDDDFTAQYEQYIASCRTSTDALGKAKAKVVSEFSVTLTQSLDQMTDIVNQIKTIGSPNALDSDSEQMTQLQNLSAQLVDLDTSAGAINEFQDKLRQSRENADPSTLLKKLNAVLQEGYDAQSNK